MKFTAAGKIVLLILVIGLAFGCWKGWQRYGAALIPNAKTMASAVPPKAELPPVEGASTGAVFSNIPYDAPGTAPGQPDKPEVRMLLYAWNAQMGAMLANGGPQSTSGSLMCKHGVNLKLLRQDDNNVMQTNLVAFATALSKGEANPSEGDHFVCIMGDGSATFLKGVNDILRKLGTGYMAKVVGSTGYSRGEDKFMGPADWKINPTDSKGGVVAGVLRDGDWNIAQKWLGDNGLSNNPDEKTYDPDALNWVAANDYIDAAQKYISGYSEDRPVVRNGKRTGETKHITIDGVVTWTPGDVNVAQQKGGLASIVSTREYTTQMPQVIIGIDKWMRDNRQTVEGMLQAFCEGGDQIRANENALQRANDVSQQVYQEKDVSADYWMRYYKGAHEKDKQGNSIDLGGSYANNLPDNLSLFGLLPGTSNKYAATYKVFGDIVVAQYPELVSSYYPVADILDTSYLADIAKTAGSTPEQLLTAAKPQYTPDKEVTDVVSHKSWHIQFDTGKASFTGGAQGDLQKLERDLLVASGTVIEINGHTDNSGSPEANMQLSEARAFAVRNWLMQQSSVDFPASRFRIHAHGSEEPLEPNTTADGRAANRRVDIVLGTTGAGH